MLTNVTEAVATIDPTALALLSIFGGAALTVAAGFVGAIIQARREHAKWIREQRFDAYQRVLRLIDHMRHVNEDLREWQDMTDFPDDMPEDARESAKAKLGKMIGAESTGFGQWRRGREVREEYVEVNASLSILGPPRVAFDLGRAMQALNDKDDARHREAMAEMKSAMRRALGVKD